MLTNTVSAVIFICFCLLPCFFGRWSPSYLSHHFCQSLLSVNQFLTYICIPLFVWSVRTAFPDVIANFPLTLCTYSRQMHKLQVCIDAMKRKKILACWVCMRKRVIWTFFHLIIVCFEVSKCKWLAWKKKKEERKEKRNITCCNSNVLSFAIILSYHLLFSEGHWPWETCPFLVMFDSWGFVENSKLGFPSVSWVVTT